jgi:hypothetical protein
MAQDQSITDFLRLANQLTGAAVEYAGQEPTEEAQASMRQLLTACSALVAAISQLQALRPIVINRPEPPC